MKGNSNVQQHPSDDLKRVSTRVRDARSIRFNEGGVFSGLAVGGGLARYPCQHPEPSPAPMFAVEGAALWEVLETESGRRDKDCAPDTRTEPGRGSAALLPRAESQSTQDLWPLTSRLSGQRTGASSSPELGCVGSQARDP